MGKRHFNEEWLDKPDANGQAISLWCIKKNNFTATCKQHSEKKKHKGFSSTLQKVKDKEKVEEADKPKCTDSQKVLQDFFVKSSTSTSKATASSVETSDFAQDIGPSTSHTTVTEVVDTSPVSCKGRDNSYFTVCFTKYTIQLCRCTPGMLQTTVSRLSNSKAYFTWITTNVIYGGIWPSPILPTGSSERNNSREFILHCAL